MAAPQFKVDVSYLGSTLEEWRKAMDAPDAELPRLTEDQKEAARRFRITESEYARSLLAGRLGNQRMRRRGERLGERALEVLERLGSGFQLKRVLWQGSKLRWILQIHARDQAIDVAVPFEIADDVIDFNIPDAVGKFRSAVLKGIGPPELLQRNGG